MEEDLTKVLYGLVITGIGWFVKMLWGKVSSLEKSVGDHKLYAAETYVTQADFDRGIDKILCKLEKIDEKLDRKQDKVN